MTQHTCEKCGGVYLDPQPDGSRYVHVCPPPAAPAPAKPRGLVGRAWDRILGRKAKEA